MSCGFLHHATCYQPVEDSVVESGIWKTLSRSCVMLDVKLSHLLAWQIGFCKLVLHGISNLSRCWGMLIYTILLSLIFGFWMVVLGCTLMSFPISPMTCICVCVKERAQYVHPFICSYAARVSERVRPYVFWLYMWSSWFEFSAVCLISWTPAFFQRQRIKLEVHAKMLWASIQSFSSWMKKKTLTFSGSAFAPHYLQRSLFLRGRTH